LAIVALITPQRVAQKAEARQRQLEKEQAQRQAAAATALTQVAEDPQCVWFQTTKKRFLVAEKRLCGGCSPDQPQGTEIAAQWLSQVMTWVR
jgi:hypothetical protein